MRYFLLFITCTILLLNANAQPQVFLGSSYTFVNKYMSKQSSWYLSKANKNELEYKNFGTKIILTYHFVRNTPSGITRTCNQCTIHLPDSAAADAYINERLLSCRIDDGYIGWVLNTDLTDYPIHITRFGNRIIYKY